MTHLEKEQRDLAKAECDIADAEHRVGAQALLVQRLHAGGHDTREAEKLLGSMRHLTELLHGHREIILKQIARLRA